ncbi:hypothetical protein AAG570_011031 [Ranatra chinensis]|uniref:Uncharacterized protein n=1 Tax=Ranatra chinensis TaxID=642074 RepID=A0ABD0Z7R3_9HEMI
MAFFNPFPSLRCKKRTKRLFVFLFRLSVGGGSGGGGFKKRKPGCECHRGSTRNSGYPQETDSQTRYTGAFQPHGKEYSEGENEPQILQKQLSRPVADAEHPGGANPSGGGTDPADSRRYHWPALHHSQSGSNPLRRRPPGGSRWRADLRRTGSQEVGAVLPAGEQTHPRRPRDGREIVLALSS